MKKRQTKSMKFLANAMQSQIELEKEFLQRPSLEIAKKLGFSDLAHCEKYCKSQHK